MSLSDRVKDALSGNDSKDTDSTYARPPGSFPTDDMSPQDSATIGSTHERNKLHKANDPRGQGHGHTDSGVGLESSNEPAVTKERVEDAYAPAEGYEERREHAERSGVAEFDDVKAEKKDTTDYNVDPSDLGTTAATSTGANIRSTDDSAPRNEVRTGTQKSTVDHKDPYWGDLPQGQGVYNTVSGHGSNSDEARRQHTDDKSGLTQGQGIYNTVAGHGSSADETRRQRTSDDNAEHRSFPLVTDRTRQHPEHDSTTNPQTETTQDKKDSHWKEGVAGGAVAGAAGTAAYKAHRDDENRSKATSTEETPEEKEKKGRGGLFGVFHRGSKDDKEKDHHKDKEHNHKDKHNKEDKAAPIAAAGIASRDDNKRHDEQRTENPTDASRSTRTDPALAAAAAAYTQHGDGHNTSSSRQTDPTATRGNNDGYNHLSSGTASGVHPSDTTTSGTRDTTTSRPTDDNKDSNRNAVLYGAAGGAAALGAGGYAAHEYGKDRDDKNTTTSRQTDPTATRGNNDGYNHLSSGTASGVRPSDTTTSTTQSTTTSRATDDNKDSNRNALYGAAGGAAALGAGGYAAHEYSKDRDNKNDDLTKDTRDESSRSGGWFTGAKTSGNEARHADQTQRDTYTKDDSNNRTGTFAAAPVPTSSSTRDPAADTYPSATGTTGAAGTTATTGPSGVTGSQSSQPTMREPSAEIPRVTEDANHGQYNTLASGTPSGINVGGNDKSSATSAIPAVTDEKSNKGAYATAGLAAAGAGAGAAAYASRDDDKEKKTEHKPVQKDTYTSSAVPTSGGQQKVTHTCTKCGEENDITSYFKDKKNNVL